MSEDPAVAVLEQPTTSPERPERSPVPQSWQKGFWSLVVTQFQGAFNDNAYKNLVVFLTRAVYQLHANVVEQIWRRFEE